jgi:hypothetical protein
MTTSTDSPLLLEQRFLAIQESLLSDILNGVPLLPEKYILATSIEDYMNAYRGNDDAPSDTGASDELGVPPVDNTIG